MLQTFCVPVGGGEEPDAFSNRLRAPEHCKEPIQGWAAWAEDIASMIGICETAEALDRVRSEMPSLRRQKQEQSGLRKDRRRL